MTFSGVRWLLPVVLLAAGCSGSSDSTSAQGDEAVTEARVLFSDKIATATAKYPIVLEHGFAASAEESSIWKFDGVVEDLTAAGHVLVVADEVQPFNSAAARAATMEQTLRQVKAQCDSTAGCDSTGVHVIAHSFGGLHSREYIRLHPPSRAADEGLPRVVSLTTVSTPNRGTAIADVGLKVIGAFKEHPSLEAIALDDLNALAGLVGRTFTKEELVSDPHIEEALHDLAEANADDFAAAHPADPDVQYFAWAGVSQNADLILHPFHPERITQAMPSDCTTTVSFQDRAYETDLILVAAHDITGHLLSGEPNDGMATVASARGLPGATFMGCVPADHLGEVGHSSTPAKRAWTGFDHKVFYRYVAGELAKIERR